LLSMAFDGHIRLEKGRGGLKFFPTNDHEYFDEVEKLLNSAKEIAEKGNVEPVHPITYCKICEFLAKYCHNTEDYDRANYYACIGLDWPDLPQETIDALSKYLK